MGSLSITEERAAASVIPSSSTYFEAIGTLHLPVRKTDAAV
jgi:hypothetical protein